MELSIVILSCARAVESGNSFFFLVFIPITTICNLIGFCQI